MHPATFYIKFLLAERHSEGGLSNGEANSALASLGINPVEPDEFDRLNASFRSSVPSTFMFNNRGHAETSEFMRKERIFQLWAPSNGERDVFDFLLLARPRETAQVLLIGGLGYDDIAEKVTSKYRLNVSVKESTIKTLFHYFWNVDIATTAEWSTYLHDDPMRHSYMSALRGGPKHALFKAGFDPEVGGKDVLRNAYMHAHFRLDETRHMNTDPASSIIARLSKEISNLYSMLYGEGEDTLTLLKDLEAIMMKNKDPQIPSVEDIVVTGSYSGTGGKDE